jgi:hypothetical protein
MEENNETIIKEFHNFVINNEGFVLSDGTLNSVHLLAKAYDFLKNNELNENLRKEILTVFEVDGVIEEGLFAKQYWGEATIPQEKTFEANEILNEDVFNYFMEISPKGYSFGNQEGDGACIGWFRYEEDDEDFEDDFHE